MHFNSNFDKTKKTKKKQHGATQRELEPIGPTLLKNPLDTRWGLTTYLAVDGLMFVKK